MSAQKLAFAGRLVMAGLFLAGAAGAYIYLQGIGRQLTPVDSAKIVPKDTMLAAYIDTDSQNWQRLQQFGSPEFQTAIAKSFESLEKGIFSQKELNYQTDLKPWVGDVMLALLPPLSDNNSKLNQASPNATAAPESKTSTNPQGNAEENVLLVVGIQNPLRAWLFQRDFQSKTQLKLEEFEYKGVKISQSIIGENPPNYSAVLGKHLLLAEQQKVLEKAIDSYQNSASLATSSEGIELLKKWQEIKNPVLQVYLPNSTILTQGWPGNMSENPRLSETAAGIKYAVVSAGIEPDGIRIKAIAKVDPELIPKPALRENQTGLLHRFPSETIALINGKGLKSYWAMVVEQVSIDPVMANNLTAMKTAFKANTNLDLDRDIFSWMDGEFALGIMPSNQGILAQIGFGGVMLLETSDRPLAEATMKKIDQTFATKFPLLEVGAKTYEKLPVTEWKVKSQDIVLGGYGWLEPNLLLIALGQPMISLMSQPIAAPLNTSQNFLAIAGLLPTPNQSYFYLNMEQLMTIVNRAPLPPGNQISPDVLAVLNSIQGIGVTSIRPAAEITQMDMLVALKSKQ